MSTSRQIVECTAANEIRATGSAFDPAEFEVERADVHLVVVEDHAGPVAYCSLWWSHVPKVPNQRIGAIGHYRAGNEGAAQLLLAAACDRLRRVGCTLAIGPMNGNTWRRYRFVTDAGDEPAFFLEPYNPPQWPQHFVSAGFGLLTTYFSALNTDLSQKVRRLTRAEKRLRLLGVALRPLKPGELDVYLPRFHRLCCEAFRNNFLYSELSQDNFIRQYAGILPLLRPDLVLIAEQNTDLVGFILAAPDHLRAARGLPADTFIIKTVAIRPRRELGGLGALLVGEAQRIGRQIGFRRCIHALMHERNRLALNISDASAKPMRRYALFAKDLQV